MRKFNLVVFLLSAAIAAGQEPAAPAKAPEQAEPAKPPARIPIPPVLPRDFRVVTLPVGGMCVIPLRTAPIPANNSEKVLPPPANVDKMPIAKGPPICGSARR